MDLIFFPIICICCLVVTVKELKGVAPEYKGERVAAVVGIALGLVVSGFIAAPLDWYFLPNVIFYWFTQLCVIAFVVSLKPRPAHIAGAALSLAVYLGAFAGWVFFCKGDSMAWLGYFFSIPGAAAGAGLAVLYTRRRPMLYGFTVGSITLILSLLGVIVAQLIICNTLMSCGCP